MVSSGAVALHERMGIQWQVFIEAHGGRRMVLGWCETEADADAAIRAINLTTQVEKLRGRRA